MQHYFIFCFLVNVLPDTFHQLSVSHFKIKGYANFSRGVVLFLPSIYHLFVQFKFSIQPDLFCIVNLIISFYFLILSLSQRFE